MGRRLVLLGAFVVLLGYCTARDLTCTVSREANGETTFRVEDSGQSKCDFSWADAQNVVLATQMDEKDDRVLFKNKTTLIMRTGIDVVLYATECFSEGLKLGAICNATSTGTDDIGTAETENLPVIIACVVGAVLLLVAVAVAVLHPTTRDFLRGLRSYLTVCPERAMDYIPAASQPQECVICPLGRGTVCFMEDK